MNLLREVEKFLRRNETAPTRFGREAVGDPRFVFDLRNGRDPAPDDRGSRPRLSGGSPVTRIPMSPVAAALLRALIRRANVSRDRILLTDARSVDWRSLTFSGERHQFALRITGSKTQEVANQMCAGLDECEFSIPAIVVADISLAGAPTANADGSMLLTIEALTVADD